MKITFIIAQVFGVFALIILALSLNKNNKKHLLKYQTLSNLCFALQYLFLNAFPGFSSFAMAILRNYIFAKYKNGKVPKDIVFAFIVATIFLSLLSFQNIFSFLPVIGVCTYTYSLNLKKLKYARRAELFASVLCIIYSLIVHAYTGIIGLAFEALMVSIAIYRFDIKKGF